MSEIKEDLGITKKELWIGLKWFMIVVAVLSLFGFILSSLIT